MISERHVRKHDSIDIDNVVVAIFRACGRHLSSVQHSRTFNPTSVVSPSLQLDVAHPMVNILSSPVLITPI